MLLAIGVAGEGTKVTSRKLDGEVVERFVVMTDCRVAVATVVVFSSEDALFVGIFAVATGELLTHMVTRAASSSVVDVASCDRVSRNSV